MDITKKDILKFTFLPGFAPRFKELFGKGFQYVPFFIAFLYSAVRLLPANHPYTNPNNMGQYGLRHVIAAAASNIEFKKENIDQVILFFSVLVGLAIITIQFAILLLAIVMPPAMAAAIIPAATMPTNFAGFFLFATPQHDLAYMMLDLVFGVPDMFNSCVATGGGCIGLDGTATGFAVTSLPAGSTGVGTNNWGLENTGFPLPVHDGLHQLFLIYSLGLLVVATLITLYFIVTILAETAQSGTAFGKRFNKVWAPIRIVVAFGLLIPIGVGMNASQYIVLYAAKFGTGFANQGWNMFTTNLTNVHGIQTTELVGQPNIPEVGGLLQFLFVAKTCQYTQLADGNNNGATPPLPLVQPYFVRGQLEGWPNEEITRATTYNTMIAFADGESQVVIRFGRPNRIDHSAYAGFIEPTCGELVIPLTDPRPAGAAKSGVQALQQYYLYIIQELWYDVLEGRPVGASVNLANNYPENYMRRGMTSTSFHDPNATLPPTDIRTQLLAFYQDDVRAVLNNPGATGINGVIGGTGAIELMQNEGRWNIDRVVLDKGWACAACMYNRIAEMNGTITSATLNIPMPTRYPKIMEQVHEQKRKQDQDTDFATRFQPKLASGIKIPIPGRTGKERAETLWMAFKFWQDGGVSSPHSAPTGNAIVDTINALMGTEGLFSMRRNASIHPIAQLSTAGKALIEASIRNLTYAAVGASAGAGLKFLNEFVGETAATASSFLVTFGMLALTAGFILYYVVPFLPFIYFFFAFGGWVKGIFEAMVGAPLWALAHIRIDQNGLSGQAALSGYFLIFEVFLRPILMVFGLIASISIFSALIKVLNQIFTLVVANMAGFDAHAEFTGLGGVGASEITSMRNAVDEFFFTVVYVIIVYMMGMSSFKLVDLIPNNILRWMGQTVATFGDQKDDPTQKLVSTTTVGSQQTTSAIGGGLQSLAGLGKSGP